MNQIAVGGVKFDNVIARGQGPSRGCDESGGYLLNAIAIKSGRLRIILSERNRAGRGDKSPSSLVRRNDAGLFPWRRRAAFSSRVRELHPGVSTLAVQKSCDAFKRLDVLVLVNSKVLGRDAAFGGYSRGFGHHQSRATHGAAAQMHQMPIRGKAIAAGILAHRRNHDAVGKCDLTQCKRRE